MAKNCLQRSRSTTAAERTINAWGHLVGRCRFPRPATRWPRRQWPPPVIFGALGYLHLETEILPKAFGYSALGLGVIFWVCGLITVVTSIQGFINVLSGVQALWWLSAGMFIAIRGMRSMATELSMPG